MSLIIVKDSSTALHTNKRVEIPTEGGKVFIRNVGMTPLRLLRITFENNLENFIGGLDSEDMSNIIRTDIILKPKELVPLFVASSVVSDEIIKSKSILNVYLEYV